MFRKLLLGFAFSLASFAAFGQGCGQTNPNCIVPTAPAGTSNNQAASTAFVVKNNIFTNVPIGINPTTPFTPGAGAAFPGTVVDIEHAFMFNVPQQSFYIIGSTASNAFFQQLGPSSPAYSFTMNGDTTFRLIYDTQSFNDGMNNPHVTATPLIWSPTWTYFATNAAGVNPGCIVSACEAGQTVSYTAALALGWNNSNGLGETNFVNRTFFNTTNSIAFKWQDWNGTTLTDLLTVNAPTHTKPGLITAANGIQINGQLTSATGTPTIASGACGTTTNGAVVAGSTNQSGNITIGAAATTTCTISWSVTLAAAPNACVFFPANAAAAATGTTVARVGAPSTTAVVLTGSALANANYSYICL
jgi:hypothetical protein